MKLKTKLITTCAAFCLVLCLTIVSVWAVVNPSINMGGSVSFNATDVNATISGSFTGLKDTTNLTTLVYNAGLGESNPAGLDTWSDWNLEFADKDPITLTITIKNDNTKRQISGTFANTSSLSNLGIVIQKDSATYNSGDQFTIAPGRTLEFTVTISITEPNNSASGTLAFNLSLSQSETVGD